MMKSREKLLSVNSERKEFVLIRCFTLNNAIHGSKSNKKISLSSMIENCFSLNNIIYFLFRYQINLNQEKEVCL